MTADQTTADDRDDAAFRARLAPLASEVLPGGAKPPAGATEAVPGRLGALDRHCVAVRLDELDRHERPVVALVRP